VRLVGLFPKGLALTLVWDHKSGLVPDIYSLGSRLITPVVVPGIADVISLYHRKRRCRIIS